MERKTDKVRKLVAEGKVVEALRIVRTFKLGITKQQREVLNRGFECIGNANFYKALGFDTNKCIAEATSLVVELYGKELECEV